MIILPDTPAHRKQRVFQIDFGETQEPFLGGPETFVGRLGSRLGVTVDLPPMKYEQAMPWIARGLSAVGETVEFRFRQQDFVPQQPGGAVMNVAAANTDLVYMTHDQANQYPVEGQAFTITKGVRKYLHFVREQNAETGLMRLFPLLRTPMLGNETVEFMEPVIQGSFNRSRITEWDLDRALTVGLSFDIREQR